MSDDEIKEWVAKFKAIAEHMSMKECYLAFAYELREMRKHLEGNTIKNNIEGHFGSKGDKK